MSPRRRSALLRAARFFAVLIALLLPWPGLGRAYVEAFSRVGTVAVRPVFDGSGVTLSLILFPESDAHHEWYSMIFVTEEGTGAPLHKGAADLEKVGVPADGDLRGRGGCVPASQPAGVLGDGRRWGSSPGDPRLASHFHVPGQEADSSLRCGVLCGIDGGGAIARRGPGNGVRGPGAAMDARLPDLRAVGAAAHRERATTMFARRWRVEPSVATL